VALNLMQERLCQESRWGFTDLRTLSTSCTPKDAGGIPAHANQWSDWDAGCRFDFPDPDYR